MQLGKATLVEVNDERNACKYEWKFVLFEFGSARHKAEAARLQSGFEVSEKRRLNFEETFQSNVLEIESLKHKVATTSVEKIRVQVSLDDPARAVHGVLPHRTCLFCLVDAAVRRVRRRRVAVGPKHLGHTPVGMRLRYCAVSAKTFASKSASFTNAGEPAEFEVGDIFPSLRSGQPNILARYRRYPHHQPFLASG